MSTMEIFYGVYKPRPDLDLEPEDTDEFFEIEKQHGCEFVKVNGILYAYESIEKINPNGFILRIPPTDEHRFICYWYNGGASLKEVVEQVIRGNQQ